MLIHHFVDWLVYTVIAIELQIFLQFVGHMEVFWFFGFVLLWIPFVEISGINV